MALSVHTPSRDAWPLSRMRYLSSTYKALFDQPSQGDTKLLHGKQRFFRGLLMPVSQKLHDPVDNGIGFQCEPHTARSEEHTSELQSLMRISYAVFCLKKKNITL